MEGRRGRGGGDYSPPGGPWTAALGSEAESLLGAPHVTFKRVKGWLQQPLPVNRVCLQPMEVSLFITRWARTAQEHQPLSNPHLIMYF